MSLPVSQSPAHARRRASVVSPGVREELHRLAQRLAMRSTSATTAKIYQSWTRRFLVHAGGRQHEPRLALDRFLTALRAQTCSAASQRQALAALGFFFREVRGIDATPWLQRHRPVRRHGGVPTGRPSSAPQDPAEESPAGLAQRLALATDRSASEILALRIGDVDLECGLLRLPRHGVGRRRVVSVAVAPELRERLLDQIGESWRFHQLEFLAWLDRHASAHGTGGRLPTTVCRRLPLFPTLVPSTRRAALRRQLAHARSVAVDKAGDRPSATRNRIVGGTGLATARAEHVEGPRAAG